MLGLNLAAPREQKRDVGGHEKLPVGGHETAR
jgi:hypothetical protein